MNLKELLKNKKIIVITGIVMIIIISITMSISLNYKNNFETKNKKNEIKENKSKDVIKEQVVDGIKIYNVKVEIKNGLTTFTANAKNTTESPINFKGININVKGDRDITLGVNGFSVINPGETLELINYSDVDLEKATEITYSVVY